MSINFFDPQEFEKKVLILGFKNIDGADFAVETTLAIIHERYETVQDYAKAEKIRIATMEEVIVHSEAKADRGSPPESDHWYWSSTKPSKDEWTEKAVRAVRPGKPRTHKPA
jgi:hypothetical protein